MSSFFLYSSKKIEKIKFVIIIKQKRSSYGNSNHNQYCIRACIANICVILIDIKIIFDKLFV